MSGAIRRQLLALTLVTVVAPNARFTEQTQVTKIGEGLWKTASEGPTTFKIYVADPVVSQIGGIVMMEA